MSRATCDYTEGEKQFRLNAVPVRARHFPFGGFMFRCFRRFLLFVCVAWPVLAGPPLTTIQDVLYKADGARFNGPLTISWSSFQAPDNSAIVTQSTTVKVQDGLLRVQLVPTTTSTLAASYAVTYNSDGRVQFQETWSV